MKRRFVFAWLLAIIAAAAIVGHALHQNNWLHAADDQMYLSALAFRIGAPERYEAIHVDGRGLMSDRAESPWLLTRYDMRHRYRDNYAVQSYAVSVLYERESGGFIDRLAAAMQWAPLLVTLLGVALLLAALAASGDVRLATCVAVLAVLVVYEQTVFIDHGDRVLPDAGQWVSPLFVLDRVARLLIDPGESTTLWGAAPRCAFALLLLTVFVLRWQGRTALAYWLFIPAAVLHQSQAGLFLPMVVGLDLLLRPSELRRWQVLLPIAATVLMFVVRERLWFVVGWAALAAIPAGAVAYWLVHRHLERWTKRLHRLPLPTADAVLIAVGWAGFLLLTAFVNYWVSPEQSTFFWNHIAGRVLGTFRSEILIGAGYFVLWRYGLDRAAVGGAAVALPLLLAPIAYLNWPPSAFESVRDRLVGEMTALDRRLGQPLPKITGRDEEVVYFAIAKSLADGRDHLAGLR